ncbi:MAG: histidine phosphatase family protein, partial [Alphaproteobacteria bacterium]
ETMAAAQDRVLTAIAQARQYREVVMVSHQDILKSVLAHYLGMSLDHLHRFALDPASHSVVTIFDDGTARVDAINRPL